MVEGNDAAYRLFYDAYYARLLRYLLVVAAGNEDAARDALQGTLVRVVRYAKVFQEEQTFWSWLTVLARSAYSDQTRKHRRYLAFLDLFTRRSHEEVTGAGNVDADAELLALLETGLAGLAPDERDLIERKYYGRQGVRDIARGLGVSEKAIESRLTRIRRRLKNMLLEQLKHEQAK
jgi:RNA polymerase sigma-70 factor (ECF subfamily)